MDSINFAQIAPRRGGQHEAFEELCCQLARLGVPSGSSFVRLRGAGGDGGVECYTDLTDGSQIGWQAKFVFDIDTLLVQLTESLKTALRIHPQLARYVVCFPFDPTGPTGRRGWSQIEKFNSWRSKSETAARRRGRQLDIEDWPASKLLAELLKNDASGGLRSYFFDTTIFSEMWFKQHLETALSAAGPRYTPYLTVETDLWRWFNALGQTEEWSQIFKTFLKQLDGELGKLRSAVQRGRPDSFTPEWPETLRSEGASCVADLAAVRSMTSELLTAPSRPQAAACLQHIRQCLADLRELELGLREDLNARHGPGSADSPGFRQFMAEYQVSFPAANLDRVRNIMKIAGSFEEWLNSPAGWPAFESTVLLLGTAGSGKTHGVCDTTVRRLNDGQLSIVAFGHQFGGEPDPWTRLRDHLGLSGIVGRDGLLDALNAAAEASGHVMIIWLDAINETKPLRFWRDHLRPFADAISRRPFLRLCATCRTSFATHCIPNEGHWYRMEHLGFLGMEQQACQAFFAHYNLDPPIFPILQPELANPLYLTLICKTLLAKDLKSLPPGWMGLAPAIQAFLSEKNRTFALEHGTSEGAAIVPKALSAIAREIARLGETSLTWSAADRVIPDSAAISIALQPLDWLVREDLLIEDAPRMSDDTEPESVVRPAFERLGDFLIARELLAGMQPSDLPTSCQTGGRLVPYLESPETIANAGGVVSALSILIPEQFAKGTELPNLFDNEPIRAALLKVAISSYVWRDPSSFTGASGDNLREALATRGLSYAAMDAALALCSHPSAIDATWLHKFFVGRSMAVRDAVWCGYLHKSYEDRGPVLRLIQAAMELPLAALEAEVAERWATVLLWFTAAADRRVKDCATRAAIAVLREHIHVLPNVLSQMIGVNDDTVRERTLLVTYGVCLLKKDHAVLAAVCDVLVRFLARDSSSFHNALLRDHTRSIAELAQILEVNGTQAEMFAQLDSLKSPWPLQIPTEHQVKQWDDLPKLAHSCLDDDFYVYSMSCLHEWTNTIPKEEMGKWILRRVVEDFRYPNSGCESYDKYMLGTHGGGRARPTWAERIGKKYQWIAMFELAARLSDHAHRERDRWEPDLLRKPLILLEERQLDPTLPQNIVERQRSIQGWWIPASVDLSSSSTLSHQQWVQRQDDVPSLAQFLMPTEQDGQQWQLLNSYLTWDTRPKDETHNTVYRHLWIHINGFLVDEKESLNAFNGLARRNFFGKWMPEGATWLYGFAAEYPWGAAFNMEPESYHESGSDQSELPGGFTPVNVELAAEWQYDASLPENRYFSLPSRVFFQSGDLWWNGKDGFRRADGETVFRAPDVTEPGPSALIANPDELLLRLKRIHKQLIWTLLGEKLIIGGPHDQRFPRRTFSQVAMFNSNGSIKSSDLVFFDDYRKDTGFLPGVTRTKPPEKKKRGATEVSRKPSRNIRNPKHVATSQSPKHE